MNSPIKPLTFLTKTAKAAKGSEHQFSTGKRIPMTDTALFYMNVQPSDLFPDLIDQTGNKSDRKVLPLAKKILTVSFLSKTKNRGDRMSQYFLNLK